jgi:hypothetical protein
VFTETDETHPELTDTAENAAAYDALGGTPQQVLTFSSVGSLRRCERYYQLKYERALRPRGGEPESASMTTGLLVHDIIDYLTEVSGRAPWPHAVFSEWRRRQPGPVTPGAERSAAGKLAAAVAMACAAVAKWSP